MRVWLLVLSVAVILAGCGRIQPVEREQVVIGQGLSVQGSRDKAIASGGAALAPTPALRGRFFCFFCFFCCIFSCLFFFFFLEEEEEEGASAGRGRFAGAVAAAAAGAAEEEEEEEEEAGGGGAAICGPSSSLSDSELLLDIIV